MKKLFLYCVLALGAGYGYANASPYLMSDPYPGQITLTYSDGTTKQADVTHCGITLDTNARIDSPVATNAAGGKYCKYDIGTLKAGQHVAKARFVLINADLTGGRAESVDTPNFTFNITATATATGMAVPGGLAITP